MYCNLGVVAVRNATVMFFIRSHGLSDVGSVNRKSSAHSDILLFVCIVSAAAAVAAGAGAGEALARTRHVQRCDNAPYKISLPRTLHHVQDIGSCACVQDRSNKEQITFHRKSATTCRCAAAAADLSRSTRQNRMLEPRTSLGNTVVQQ